MTNKHEYQCYMCKGVFTTDWSDEEAEAERQRLWGGKLGDEVVVCDDCFKKFYRSVTN